MIKILIVDDSETETQLLKYIFSQDPNIEIIGYARNGKDAIFLANKLKPDLITMDIQMPVMDGLEAIRYIMSHQPVPIVVISSKLDSTLDLTFSALEAGAVSVIDKPKAITSPNFKESQNRIIDAVRGLAEIQVIKRRFFSKSTKYKTKVAPPSDNASRNYEIVTIGVSVGGPQVLKIILSALPANFPVPIAIVQHMSEGFITGFTKWLDDNTALLVQEAHHLELLNPGTVYFAPDNFHFELDRQNEHLVAKLVKGKAISGFCPSATALFRSAAKISGNKAIGLLLTGMGNDGADGLLELKKAHGHTLIQDKQSSVVFGMAGAAQLLGAVDKEIKLDQIAQYLIDVTTKPKK